MSQRPITLGHPEAHEKLTGRLFWKQCGEPGYIDAGNVPEYSDSTTRSLVSRPSARRGARHVNNEQTDVDHQSFSFLLDERVPEQEALIRLANKNTTDQEQLAGEGATATIENVGQNMWHEIGVYNIANVRVTASQGGEMEADTDFEIDKENGRIKVIRGGGIGNGETLSLTFDKPAITLQTQASRYKPLFYCDIIIEETNQYHRLCLRRLTFKGYVNVTEFPSHSGEFGKYRVKVTPAEKITILKRPEAQTLPEIENDETASSSSSSSTVASLTSSSSSPSSSSSSSSSRSSHSSSSTAQLVSSSSSSSTALSYSSNSSSNSSSYSSNSSSSSTSSVNSSSSHSVSSSSTPSSASSASSSSSSSTAQSNTSSSSSPSSASSASTAQQVTSSSSSSSSTNLGSEGSEIR